MSAPHAMGVSHHLDIDGRRLHYRRAGEGAPTVVFESGMGFSGAAWGRVQPEIARRTTTIAHDRAGFGGSEADAAPRTLERLADDLDALLASLAGPVVLVGHSWGGPIVRTVAARGRHDVRALVLVDQTDENIDAYFSPSVEKQMTQTGPLFQIAMKLSVAMLRRQALRGQSADVRIDLRRDLSSLGTTMGMELPHFLTSLRPLREEPERMDALAGIPMTVISGTKVTLAERTRRPAINAAHAKTAERFGARFVPASRSGHNVMFEQPDLVVSEVLRYL